MKNILSRTVKVSKALHHQCQNEGLDPLIISKYNVIASVPLKLFLQR